MGEAQPQPSEVASVPLHGDSLTVRDERAPSAQKHRAPPCRPRPPLPTAPGAVGEHGAGPGVSIFLVAWYR